MDQSVVKEVGDGSCGPAGGLGVRYAGKRGSKGDMPRWLGKCGSQGLRWCMVDLGARLHVSSHCVYHTGCDCGYFSDSCLGLFGRPSMPQMECVTLCLIPDRFVKCPLSFSSSFPAVLSWFPEAVVGIQ